MFFFRRVLGAGIRIQGPEFSVSGSGFRMWGAVRTDLLDRSVLFPPLAFFRDPRLHQLPKRLDQ